MKKTNNRQICAECGQAMVGVVHCKKNIKPPRDEEEAKFGNKICCKHCYEGCKYFDMRISIHKCTYPKVAYIK